MDVRIGVLHTPKELTLEVAGSPEDVTAALERALAGGDGVLWLTDTKGRRVGVPGERVAYIEIDTEGEAKRVGFGRA